MLVHHDNAQPLRCSRYSRTLAALQFYPFHPSYRRYLAPRDFRLFSEVKGRIFNTDQEVIEAANTRVAREAQEKWSRVRV